MPFVFDLSDFIQIAGTLVVIIGAYWRLSGRQDLIEQRVDIMIKAMETNETKLEKRLDAIDGKIDELMKLTMKNNGNA